MREQCMEEAVDLLLELSERLSGWECSLAKLGRLSLPQLKTLCVIGRHKDVRMKDVADWLRLTTGTVTVMIDRLQAMGFVARRQNETDRRSYYLELTDQGLAIFNEHEGRQRAATRQMFARLSGDELDGVTRTVAVLLRLL